MDNLIKIIAIAISFTSLIIFADSCPEIISREEWEAKPPKNPEYLNEPVPWIVIHHTYEPPVCNSTEECKEAMRSMQIYHQDTQGWSDIGYTFCIGGDGNIYEGRGWGLVGAHAPNYNDKSVGICFIGDYRTVLPYESMLKAGEELIECGVTAGHIDENYKLVGHRQVRNTECPGDKFYSYVQTMPHWTDQNLTFVEINDKTKSRTIHYPK